MSPTPNPRRPGLEDGEYTWPIKRSSQPLGCGLARQPILKNDDF